MTELMEHPTTLVFVHLSDLHFRESGSPLSEREQALRDRLLDDIPKVVALVAGEVEAILITGDLARSGQRAEYQVARGWLDELCARLGISHTKTLTCPGNHDVDWSRLDAGRLAINEALRTCKENLIDGRIDLLLKSEPDMVLAPLENYQEFAAGSACDIEKCLAWDLPPIPFSDGYALAIRGANTVLNSDRLDGEGTMAVQTNQMIVRSRARLGPNAAFAPQPCVLAPSQTRASPIPIRTSFSTGTRTPRIIRSARPVWRSPRERSTLRNTRILPSRVTT